MLTIRNVHKEYKTGTLVQKALDGVSLSFRETEFVAILGPSGSGKTTLLNVIGGLDRYDSGEMFIRGVPTSRYSDRDWDTYRNHTIGFVFQSYNLIPHQTVLSNVELAMTLAGVGKAERTQRAMEALERVGLADQAQKKPSQLSGGQMQRVAIARALVNEPSVLLADEPTGALDSDTGEQVMELLREVAKDHLVVMVTHNPELADRYATRIVRLRDGQVRTDTDPYDPETETDLVANKKEPGDAKATHVRKPSMSFATALSLSVANLWSKKARTILVAFAASIGIVGIALILSLSNGANTYIRQTERDSLSRYPIEILYSAFSMEDTMMALAAMRSGNTGTDTSTAGSGASGASGGDEDDKGAEEADGSNETIREQQMMGSMLSSAKANDLASLKRWFDSGQSGIEPYVRGIDYSYGISPQIYQLKEEGGFRQVNPDQTLASFGISMDESMTGAASVVGMNEVFRALPENEDLYLDDYTLLAGEWPKKDTDLVLVLSGTGGIPDMLLYTMGIRDADELNSEIENVVAGVDSGKELDESRVFDPEDFLGITFSLVPAYETYAFDQNAGVWVDQSADEARMNELVQNGEEMRIVGVVRPTGDVTFGILEIGLEYPAALVRRLIGQAKESDVVRAQLADEKTNVLTGTAFGESGSDKAMGLADMIEIKPEKLPDAISINWDGMDNLETDATRLTAKRTVKIIRELSRTGKSETLREMMEAAMPLLMDLIEVDEEKIGEAISFAMDEAHMQEMFAAKAAAGSATCAGNLAKFGYADPTQPSRVTIYPADFDGKNEVIRLLEAYNAAMEAEGYEDKVITYTDYVGALMSSVTTIIDVITYVLIAFVAVSLVVSSIMIGIITYISVLERRKEIGILRAMGASKWNIAEVFNAETFIIGLLAGVFGIVLTLLLQIPINRVIRQVAGQDGIRAFLPFGAATILILLCVFLTVLGGFIPSQKAAGQDPVAALRSE